MTESRPAGLLHNKKAIVTGGASGIGLAICERFESEGAEVLCIDKQNLTHITEQRHFLKADLSDAHQAEQAIRQAADMLGTIDILVNNAGCGALASLHDYDNHHFDQLIKNNFYSVFYCSRAALELMLEKGGTIVNIASETAQRPTAGEAPYSAAKAAVVSLCKSTALEYGPYGVRCNAISPGVIDTPLTEFILQPDIIKPMLEQCPLRRVGTTEEIANVALFLSSPLSSYINGQNITVDGGLSLPQAGINDVTAGLTHMMKPK